MRLSSPLKGKQGEKWGRKMAKRKKQNGVSDFAN
jgi:hypothetical protein